MERRQCVDRRIAEIQTLLDAAATRPNIVTPQWIGRPQYWTFHSNRWEAESQAGRAALIDRDKLSDYGILYAQMNDLQNEMSFPPARDRRIYVVWIALVWAGMMAWNVWRHGRVHPALLTSGVLLATGEAMAVALEFSPWWHVTAARLVAAWGWTG